MSLPRSYAPSANRCFSQGQRLRTAAMIRSAPAASCTSAVVRLTISSRPSGPCTSVNWCSSSSASPSSTKVTAGPCQVADRVEDLAQVHAGLAAALGRSRQQGRDLSPLCIGQIGRVATPLESVLAQALLLGPHPAHVGLRAAQTEPYAAFSNGLLMSIIKMIKSKL